MGKLSLNELLFILFVSKSYFCPKAEKKSMYTGCIHNRTSCQSFSSVYFVFDHFPLFAIAVVVIVKCTHLSLCQELWFCFTWTEEISCQPCGIASKTTAYSANIPSRCLFQSPQLHFPSDCLLMCLRKQWNVVQLLDPLNPWIQVGDLDEAPGLTSAWPNPSCCDHLGSELKDKRFFPFFSVSSFL